MFPSEYPRPPLHGKPQRRLPLELYRQGKSCLPAWNPKRWLPLGALQAGE